MLPLNSLKILLSKQPPLVILSMHSKYSKILIKGSMHYNVYVYVHQINQRIWTVLRVIANGRKTTEKADGELFKDMCSRHKLEMEVWIKIGKDIEAEYNSFTKCSQYLLKIP
uniref:Uncharacterized protein n=1 Tax=Glossina austeni TaxID=7395 RepID=A0A1A9V9V9_GLOAU